jgi:hypothetical protein
MDKDLDKLSVTEFEKEFILLEYSEIRKQNQSYIDETNNLARYAVTVAGLVWTWLLIQKPPERVIQIASWLPLITSILFTARVITLWLELLHRSRYIRRIEKLLRLPNNLGFEGSLPADGRSWIFWSAAFFWAVLIIASALAPKLLFG